MTSRRTIISIALWAISINAPVQSLLAAQGAARNPLQLAADHATVSVADWDKECQWYQHVLGFQVLKPAKQEAEKKICYLTIPGFRLDVIWQKGSVRRDITTGIPQQGWLNIEFKTADIKGVYKHLSDQGIDVKVDRSDGGSIQHLKFLDPENNEIGIIIP